MADLLIKNTSKGVQPSRLDRETQRRRENMKAFDAQFAALARNKVAPSTRSQSMIAGHYEEFPPAPETAKKVDPLADLPESVKRIAYRTSAEGAVLLGAIVKRHEETGEAIQFTVSDAAEVMKVSREQAERIMGYLLQAGLLTPRASSLGPVGYVPTLPVL